SFGDVTLPAPDDAKLLSSFVVGFDSSGKAFWSVRGDTSGMYNQVAQVAVARDGNLLVTGSLSGNLDLGNKTLSSQVFDKSLLVAKLDPRKNAAVFAKNFGTCVTGHAITEDAETNLWVAGTYECTTNFGGEDLKPASQEKSFFLLKLKPDGSHLF